MSTLLRQAETIGPGVTSIESWNPAAEVANEEFEYIDIASIDRDAKLIASTTRMTAGNAPSRARQIVRANDVLVSTVRPNLNAVALVPQSLDGAIASTGFCVLRCLPSRLDYRYLFHWVRTPQFVAQMVRVATGASYPAVSDRIIKHSEIPLRPIAEQRRIADILDKSDAIRRMQNESHHLAKLLPYSLFHGTFLRRELGARAVLPLSEVAEVVSGVAKGRQLNGADVREVPYLRVANVQAGFLDLSEIKNIPATEREVNELRLQPGDVVMTEGGDYDKLGRGALWEHHIPDCIHQNHVFRVRPDRKRMLPSFFVHYLQTQAAKGYFLQCAKKTTNLASINMRQLRALPVPLPPIDVQLRFEREVKSVHHIVGLHSERIAESSKLFDSLVQRAFRGEL